MQMTLQRQKFIVVEEKYKMNGLSQIMAKDLTFSIDGGDEISIIDSLETLITTMFDILSFIQCMKTCNNKLHSMYENSQ